MEYLLSIGVAMLAGLMLTRLTKKFNLPDVTSFIRYLIRIRPTARVSTAPSARWKEFKPMPLRTSDNIPISSPFSKSRAGNPRGFCDAYFIASWNCAFRVSTSGLMRNAR